MLYFEILPKTSNFEQFIWRLIYFFIKLHVCMSPLLFTKNNIIWYLGIVQCISENHTSSIRFLKSEIIKPTTKMICYCMRTMCQCENSINKKVQRAAAHV